MEAPGENSEELITLIIGGLKQVDLSIYSIINFSKIWQKWSQ